MNKENMKAANTTSIMRAHARALGAVGRIPPASKPSFKQDQRHFVRVKTKRAASDENAASSTAIVGVQHKRRAVLEDISNVCCDNAVASCIKIAKLQSKHSIKCPGKKQKELAANNSTQIPQVDEDAKANLAEELSRIRMVELKAQEIMSDKQQIMCLNTEGAVHDPMLITIPSAKPA